MHSIFFNDNKPGAGGAGGRYVDRSNNKVTETRAYGHPNESPARLYQMARALEGCQTITTKDWLLAKNIPA